RAPLALVRFALSKEVLETSPIPSLRLISLRAAAVSSACSRLSSAQGPAMSANGSALPNRTPPTVTAAFGAGSMARSIRIAPDHALQTGRGQRRADRSHTSPEYSWRLHQPALLDRRLDEGGEQRVRLERAGFQLRVELHPDEPRMILVLDDLRQDAVGRHAGEPHAELLEPAL